MERFDLVGSMGELRVSGLGNASPQSASVRHRMGEVNVDLRGDWRRDAAISVRCGMGACGLRLPVGVAVEVDEVSAGWGEVNMSALDRMPPPAEGAPTLNLEMTAKMGEVRLSR
jgi:hypothetical protein